jgi:hypothetical protein
MLPNAAVALSLLVLIWKVSGARFVILTEFLVGYFYLHHPNTWILFLIGDNRFLPYPFQFIVDSQHTIRFATSEIYIKQTLDHTCIRLEVGHR